MPTELVAPEEVRFESSEANQQFLTRLTGCFSDPSSSHTVFLTHKRLDKKYSGDGSGDVQMGSEGSEGEEYDVLVRCTHGDITKFSSRIPSSRLPDFHAKYGSLLRSSMAGSMRKRDKKREKARAEEVAKRKRELYEDVKVPETGKRGKGRRQRQRKIQQQKRKETEREKVESRSAAAPKVTAEASTA